MVSDPLPLQGITISFTVYVQINCVAMCILYIGVGSFVKVEVLIVVTLCAQSASEKF